MGLTSLSMKKQHLRGAIRSQVSQAKQAIDDQETPQLAVVSEEGPHSDDDGNEAA